MASVRRKAGTRLITGDKEIDKVLARMKIGAANKIARPALTNGARIILKAQKAGVPPDKKYIKKLLGMRVDAKGGKSKDQQRAKVGAGVGKAHKVEAVRSGKNTGGVGIGGPNVHWALLGADGSSKGGPPRQKKTTGKSTGAMPAQSPGLIKQTTEAALPSARSAIRDEAAKRLAQLAAKK